MGYYSLCFLTINTARNQEIQWFPVNLFKNRVKISSDSLVHRIRSLHSDYDTSSIDNNEGNGNKEPILRGV